MSTGRFFFTSEILNIFAWNWKLIEQKYLGLQWHFWVSNFWTFVTSEDICQFKLQQQSRYQIQPQTFTEETYLPLNIKILCSGVCGKVCQSPDAKNTSEKHFINHGHGQTVQWQQIFLGQLWIDNIQCSLYLDLWCQEICSLIFQTQMFTQCLMK